MASNHSLTPLSENDYEAIEAAVMETGRGRWFLSEFAKRNRHSDTTILLDAIGRLEHSLVGENGSLPIERIRNDLMEMATTIAQLKIELASDNPDQNSFEQATEALDAVVQTTENATSHILEAAEQIQEMAWTLRESGASTSICDILDQRSADIYTACSFQDLTAQRTKKVVRTLRSIEGRINGLVDAWNAGDKPEGHDLRMTAGDHTLVQGQDRRHASAPIDSHLSHDDIELVMREDGGALIEHGEHRAALPLELAPPASKIVHGPDAVPVSHHGLAEIDALPTLRKIEMFS